jgi:hypothetical protein
MNLGEQNILNIISNPPANFLIERPYYDHHHDVNTIDMRIPTSSRQYYKYAVTTLLLLCKDNDIPAEMTRHIWLFLSLNDWTRGTDLLFGFWKQLTLLENQYQVLIDELE